MIYKPAPNDSIDTASTVEASWDIDTQMRSLSPINAATSMPIVVGEQNLHNSASILSRPHVPDASAPPAQDPILIHNSYLDTLNLVVNAEFRFLCCELCETAVLTQHAKSHTRKHLGLKFDSTKFHEAILETGVPPDLPIISSVRLPVHGLSIQDAFACNHCSKILLSAKKIQAHHASQHKETPMAGSWRPCQAQRFQKGGGQPGHQLFWEVSIKPDADPTTEDQIVLDVLAKIREDLTIATVPQDDRMVSPWLLTTRWHEHVSGHMTGDLRAMVAIPQNDDGEDLVKLKEVVEVYFQGALDLLPTTDELTLKRLNSPDPIKL
jgi:hypothetical protein